MLDPQNEIKMAALGSITLNEIVIYEVDADPSVEGLSAPSGSIAILTDGSGSFQKGEGDQFDWVNHVITDHGKLSGLTDDDHAQYHTDTRADLRYYTKTQSDSNFEPKNSNIQSHISSTSNPHSVTKSQVGLGSVPNVDATLRSNHTGTQLASTISDFTTAVQAVTIDAAKIGGGVVSNAEFATLDGISTATTIQVQIDGKQPNGNYITALTGDVVASGPGSALTTLSDTGVTAGTYSQVTVDSKGRITSGSNIGNSTVYKYSNTVTVSNTNATYTTVAQLTTASLPVGLYKFSFLGLMQSAGAAAGVGVRVAPVGATVTTCYGDWHLKQAADGVNAVFHYNQLTAATNVTSASVPVANSNFVVSGSGVFRITVAGTVAIQIRGETNGAAATLQSDASFIIEPA